MTIERSKKVPPEGSGLFLIGYRGSGKTSVGERLAAAWGWSFVDSDRLIEERASSSIAEVFSSLGEGRFREIEEDVVVEIAGRAASGERLVAATGGGVVLRASNVSRLRESGRVIWLRASIDELRRRIAEDSHSTRDRPALVGASAADEVERVLTERLPLYASAADRVVDTDGLSIEDVVREVGRGEIR